MYCRYLIQVHWAIYTEDARASIRNTNKAIAHFFGWVPDSFQTDNPYIVGIKPGITRKEVRV